MKIPLDELLRKAIRDAISDQSPKMTFADFAKKMGHGRAWVNKLVYSGPNAASYIELEELQKAEKVLNTQFVSFTESGDLMPDFIKQLAKEAANNPALTAVLSALLEIAKPKVHFTIPTLHQKTLVRLGAAITKVVHQWEEPLDPHYAKIGLEVVEEIRDTLDEMFPSKKG